MAARCFRLQARHLPLIDRVVGDPAQADLAVRPRLPPRPLDAVEEVLGLARRPMLDVAGRAPAAARVDAHAHIAVRHPLLGIAHFPALVLVGRPRRHAGVLFRHARPGGLIAVLEVQPLAVGAAAEDDRVTPLPDRPEDVASQLQSVVHRDRHVPVDPHSIADLADLTVTHGLLLRIKRFCAESAGRLVELAAWRFQSRLRVVQPDEPSRPAHDGVLILAHLAGMTGKRT